MDVEIFLTDLVNQIILLETDKRNYELYKESRVDEILSTFEFKYLSDFTLYAAQLGNLKIFKKLMDHGFMLNEFCLRDSIERKKFGLAQFILRENLISLKPRDMNYFAANKDLCSISFAFYHGCPWGSNTLLVCAKHGCYKTFHFCFENGAPVDEFLVSYVKKMKDKRFQQLLRC